MTQTATVRRLMPQHRVELSIMRQSACGHDCSKCGAGCSMMTPQEVLVVADDPVGVQPGDTVTVESSTGKMMKAAVVVYAVPLVLFFALYVILDTLGAEESVSTAGAILGFVLGILGAVFYSRREKERREIQFTVTGIKEREVPSSGM